jgi:hypothetical protein
MRALENRIGAAESAEKQSEDARLKAASELDAAHELLTRRTNEALERERYYAKIEEYLNLKLIGGLDAATLAQKEARIEEREAALQRREIETETKIKEARRRMEEEFRRAQAETAASADLRIKEVREEYDQRTADRDRDLSSRLMALHEKEARLNALERSLEERRQRFEEFHATQRAAMEREAASITQMANDQAEFIERRVEQALAAKTTVIERAWQNDKQSLLEELALWRAKAREHMPALLDAQRKASILEDEHTRLVESNRVLQQSKATLSDELARWRSQAQSDLPALLASVRRAVDAEEKIKHLEAELASTKRAAEEYQAQMMSDEMAYQARVKELSRVESALSAKLRDAEQDLFRQYDSWLAREAELRRRDQYWRIQAEARHESVDVLRAEIMAQREELKRAVAAYRAKTDSVPKPDEPRNTGEHR